MTDPVAREPFYSPEEMRAALRLLGMNAEHADDEALLPRSEPKDKAPWMMSMRVVAALSLVSERIHNDVQQALSDSPQARTEFENERQRIRALGERGK